MLNVQAPEVMPKLDNLVKQQGPQTVAPVTSSQSPEVMARQTMLETAYHSCCCSCGKPEGAS